MFACMDQLFLTNFFSKYINELFAVLIYLCTGFVVQSCSSWLWYCQHYLFRIFIIFWRDHLMPLLKKCMAHPQPNTLQKQWNKYIHNSTIQMPLFTPCFDDLLLHVSRWSPFSCLKTTTCQFPLSFLYSLTNSLWEVCRLLSWLL